MSPAYLYSIYDLPRYLGAHASIMLRTHTAVLNLVPTAAGTGPIDGPIAQNKKQKCRVLTNTYVLNLVSDNRLILST